MHRMIDIMMLKFSYIIINLKNHSDWVLGFLAQITISPHVWSGQRFHTNKAKEANGWIPALQHYHVELTLGWIIFYDELNKTTYLGNMCYVEFVCKHTETGQTFNLSRGRWHQMVMSIMINATWHDTYGFWINTLWPIWIPGSIPPEIPW